MLKREQERSAPEQVGQPAQLAGERNLRRVLFACLFRLAAVFREQLVFVRQHDLRCDGDDGRFSSGNQETCHEMLPPGYDEFGVLKRR